MYEPDLTSPSKLSRGPICRGLKLAAEAESPVNRTGGKFGAGLIPGVSVITRGEALGHGMFIDGEMLKQVADAINASGDGGLKSRFTHPDLSGDGLGKMTAKMFNASVVGDQVIADAHLLQAAHDAPDGDLAKYVMDLAEEAPEDFGTSIAFQRDREGERKFAESNLIEVDSTDGLGNPVKRKIFRSPDPKNSKNLPHVRLKKLTAVDVVDEPAANPSGLFHRGPIELLDEGDRLMAFCLGLSDDVPETTVLGVESTRLRGFVQQFLSSRGMVLSKGKDMDLDNKPADTKPVDTKPEDKPDLQKQLSEAQSAAQASERRRSADIMAACVLAKKPELAADFIEKGTSLSEVQGILLKAVCQDGKPADNADQGGNSKPANPNAKYEAEYDATPDVFSSMGLTKEQYVASRRRDDGLDPLSLVPAKKAS